MIHLKDIKDLIALSNTDSVPLPFRLQPEVPLVLTFNDFVRIISEASFSDLNKVWNGTQMRVVLGDTASTNKDKTTQYFNFLYHLGLFELSYSVRYAHPPTPIYHMFEDSDVRLSVADMEAHLRNIKAEGLPSYVTQDMVGLKLIDISKVSYVNEHYKSNLLYLAYLKYPIPDIDSYWNITI